LGGELWHQAFSTEEEDRAGGVIHEYRLVA
jgi:hypothetical protein